MSIYRKSCRPTERVKMKKWFDQGWSIDQISTQLRVEPHIIVEVVEGRWDSKEKAMTLVAMEKNREEMAGKADAESNKIAQIAAAAAAAVSGQSLVVDREALRREIEAQVRAEMEAEKPVELTSGQKAAATRKANQEAREQENAA
jgi:hypothetical protein